MISKKILSEDDLSFEKDLKIEKSSLDEECIDQPRKFAKWGKLHAEALYERDLAKDKLKVLCAVLSKEIRDNPDNFAPGAKLTEKLVSDIIDLQETVIAAREDIIRLDRDVNILSVAKESFQDRKRELQNLVDLFVSNYWSNVKVNSSEQSSSTKEHRDQLGKNPRIRKG